MTKLQERLACELQDDFNAEMDNQQRRRMQDLD
jgi:hypothetical protein